jgi:hypothetical protein
MGFVVKRQSVWNMKLYWNLRKLGFTQCASKHRTYIGSVAASRVVLGIYVMTPSSLD